MPTPRNQDALLELVRFILEVRRRLVGDQIPFPSRTALLQMHTDVAGFQGIGGLVAQTRCSPSYFREHFRAHVGVAPRTYLRRYRVFAAFQLLTETPDLDVVALAERVGYGNRSSLSHAFRTEVELSPVQVRRGLRGRRFSLDFQGLLDAALVVCRSAEAAGRYRRSSAGRRTQVQRQILDSVRALQQRTPPLHSLGRPP